MLEITNMADCCGCMSCANGCPKQCIEMKPDFEGFLYPTINKDRCVNCGTCEKLCPIITKMQHDYYEPHAYVLRTLQQEVLAESTSGGFITPLTQWVFSNQGVVCAAIFDREFNVVHQLFESAKDDYEKCRGSKYVQSYIGDSYKQIEKYLKDGRVVCFIGTTCQVYGLKTYLHKDYDKLITVDLICHGVPSPKLWRKYLEYQVKEYGSVVENVRFRNKTYGYHGSTMMVKFENGRKYLGSARIDYMLKSFFSEISSRPSCYQCHFKTIRRCSDFTIYDCWHPTDIVPDLRDDDKGYTNLIVQSKNGEAVLQQIKDRYEIYRADMNKAIRLDGIMATKSAEQHPLRNVYYVDLDREPLSIHVKHFIPVTNRDRLIEKSKMIFYKLGLMRVLKILVRK